MMRNLQDIDKIFRDGLDDHPEPAPPGVWDKLNEELDKKQDFQFREKYFRLKRLAIAASVVISLSSLAFLVVLNKKKQTAPSSSIVIDNNSNTSSKAQTTGKTNAADNNGVNEQSSITSNDNSNTKAEAEVINNQKQTAVSPSVTRNDDANADLSKDAKTLNLSQHNTENNKPSVIQPAKKGNRILTDDASVTNNANVNAVSSNKQADGTVTDIADAEHNRSQQQKLAGKYKADYSKEIATGKKNNAAKNNKLKINQTSKLAGNNNNYNNANSKIDNSTSTNKQNSNSEDEIVKVDDQKQTTKADFTDELLSAYLFTPVSLPSVENNITRSFGDKALSLPDWAAEKAPQISFTPALKHRFSLSAFISPNHSSMHLENNEAFAAPRYNKYEAQKGERQTKSISAGVLLQYSLSRKWALQTGLVYSSSTTEIDDKFIFARPDNFGHARYEFYCASGNAYITPKSSPQPAVGDSILIKGSSSTLAYLGVPLTLSYAVQKGRILFKPGVGVSVNFLASGNSAANFSNTGFSSKEVTPINGLNNVYVDGSVGLGMEYMISNRISAGVRPSYRVGLTPVNTNTPVRSYQNFFGFETGLRINL